MYIRDISHYIPSQRVTNQYFADLNGLTNEWIVERTGISERRKAGAEENTATMALEAVKALEKQVDFPLQQVDLIVGASYTPYDTIVTLAHKTQHYLNATNAAVVYISSACSSFLNAMEIVEGYMAMGKSKNALVVLSEHNTAYHNEHDHKAGHLWGDGASALLVTKDKPTTPSLTVKEIFTRGAAHVGRGLEGVTLRPLHGGIEMPYGKDVFLNACSYMASATRDIIERNNYTLDDLSYLVPHQANHRITKNVAENLKLSPEKAISNVQYLGNTGCAGAAIGISEHWHEFKNEDKIVVTVFGGGYSYGAMLLVKE
ncbi:ketoacyl-ACP synthase III [Imperialibacter roseus]|uniref:Ketoacyl-ACP synthase III n=1 Tax=Imperialibacter roseus TaxID=1324217 RepID=A0ABZ0ISD2_9BACT|nr:ketoacyl-ACP synthase III [Imperialibacter roseus]WOK06865.1 ketoacyl-ACP synthase III [Imperialibacter roseus]